MLNKYLDEPVVSGSSGGYSDITFLNQVDVNGKTKEDLYFISVKYYRKEKDVASYDIGKLCISDSILLKPDKLSTQS